MTCPQAIYDAKVCDTPVMGSNHATGTEHGLLILNYCTKTSLWPTGSLWVNPVESYTLGESKLFQQATARSLGFKTPETIISTSPEIVQRFFSDHSSGIALKRVSHPPRGILRRPSRHRLYTQFLKPGDLTEGRLTNLKYCPTHFEEYIPKKSEYRIYVVGERVFAAEILSQDFEGTKVDWRHYPTVEVGDHREVDKEKWKAVRGSIPEELEERCVRLARRLGMVYTAMDFIKTPAGNFVFLEANSSGAFQFIEDHTSLPIIEAFSSLLISGKPILR